MGFSSGISLEEMYSRLYKIRIEHETLKKEIRTKKTSLRSLNTKSKNIDKAQSVVQIVAQETQKKLEYRVSELVTLALRIFPDPYDMNLNFVKKRGKTEAEFTLSRGNSEAIDPLSASGGGVVDMASFALRLSLWSLQKPRSRNLIIMDEPFRFLSTELQPKAGELLKQISEKLDLQFIIVTHEEELLESADKIFRVTQHKGVSCVSS